MDLSGIGGKRLRFSNRRRINCYQTFWNCVNYLKKDVILDEIHIWYEVDFLGLIWANYKGGQGGGGKGGEILKMYRIIG